MQAHAHVFGTLGICAALLLLAAGCEQKAPAQMATPPPPKVTVANPVQRVVTEWDEYTGRLAAVEFVDVRARVGGLITAAEFREGALVKQGDTLVEIDARPYRAALDATIAAKSEAEAQVRLAQIDYNRIEGLSRDARSRTELDTAAATLARTKSLVEAAQAQIDAAQLNVDWCRVIAPISGRISRKLVTAGNLISGGTDQGTLLTTIATVDPIYCYIDADERSILKYARLARSGERLSARQARIPFSLELGDETNFPHLGEVDFVDNRVDPTTGTILGRGILRNADGWMVPGMFARVRIPGSGRYTALLVPDSAVTADQNERLLLTVDAKHIVQRKVVKLGALFGTLRAISSGVTTEDRVIINGLLHARPGAAVEPVESTFSLESLPPEAPEPTSSQPALSTQPASQPESAPAGARS